MRLLIIIAAAIVAAACSSEEFQPQNDGVVNATLNDQAVQPGALGNETANYPEGNVTPGEMGNIHAVVQPRPEEVLRQFGDLLEQKRFADAFKLVNAEAISTTEQQFERRFDQYKTIESAVGTICPIEGAAGSLYSTVQLTLSGNRKNGTAYVMTGPVTLRRVNDVPGSTAEQRRWHIVKLDLTADPKAAEAKVEC